MLLELSSSRPVMFNENEEAKTPRTGNTVYEFSVDLRYVAFLLHAVKSTTDEMSDGEVIAAAEQAGTFDFLKSPEEAIYDDLVK